MIRFVDIQSKPASAQTCHPESPQLLRGEGSAFLFSRELGRRCEQSQG
jgi:hypothetical protein